MCRRKISCWGRKRKRRRKRREMFGEEKYLFGGIEGKKENIFVIEGKENNW